MSGRSERKIRTFLRSDLGPLRALIEETIHESYGAIYPPRAVQFFKSFHSEEKILERARSGTVLVIEEDDQLTATGSIVDHEIFAVFVRPRSQNGGRGKALMQALEAEAKKRGIEEAELSVSLPSKAFYRNLGYVIGEERSKDVGEGQQLVFWKARKRLRSVPSQSSEP